MNPPEKNTYPDKKVSEVMYDFINHTNGWKWYLFGEYHVKFQSIDTNMNACTQAKKYIFEYMDYTKTPVEIIPILHFWNLDQIEKCSFVVKKI